MAESKKRQTRPTMVVYAVPEYFCPVCGDVMRMQGAPDVALGTCDMVCDHCKRAVRLVMTSVMGPQIPYRR